MSVVRGLFERAGLYVKKYDKLPYGIDWMRDCARICGPGWSPRLVFDVGANRGQTTRTLKRHWPHAVVHAFEPVASTYATLTATVGGMNGVHCHPLALSDQAGVKTVRVLPNSQVNSLKPNRAAADPAAVIQELRLARLDDVCREHHIEQIDVLKTDTEGGDLDVLRGAGAMLADRRIRCILCEVSFDALDAQHTPFDPVRELLRTHGFRMHGLYECESLIPNHAGETYCNALFVLPGRA
jgi:FkbM family methyltransferase